MNILKGVLGVRKYYVLPKNNRKEGPFTKKELIKIYSTFDNNSGLRIRYEFSDKWEAWTHPALGIPSSCKRSGKSKKKKNIIIRKEHHVKNESSEIKDNNQVQPEKDRTAEAQSAEQSISIEKNDNFKKSNDSDSSNKGIPVKPSQVSTSRDNASFGQVRTTNPIDFRELRTINMEGKDSSGFAVKTGRLSESIDFRSRSSINSPIPDIRDSSYNTSLHSDYQVQKRTWKNIKGWIIFIIFISILFTMVLLNALKN